MPVIILHPRQLPIVDITGSGLRVSGSVIYVGQGNGLLVSGSSINLITPGSISSSSINSATGSHTHALNIFSSVLPVGIVPDATGSGGSSVYGARLDHTHAIVTVSACSLSSSAVNAEGTSNSFIRSDHIHFLNIFNSSNPMTILPDASGSPGTSPMAARLDHVHAVVTATAISLSGSSTNSEGSSTSFSRADHWHEIASYSDVSAPISAIIKSDSSGDIKLHKIELTDRVTVPLINTNAGISLAISPDQDLNLSPSGSRVRLMSPVRIQSDNYVSQTTGWGISYAGSGDFRYLYADELHARAFIADLEAVRAGVHGIFPSASVLASDFTVPAAGASAILIVDSFKGFETFRVFLDGDIVNIRQFERSGCSLNIANCYGAVTWVSTDTTNKIQTYNFVRSASPNSGAATAGIVIATGATVPDYGISGNGFIESNAIDGYRGENSPYTQIVSWTVHPNSGKVVNNRLGNLYGIFSSFGEYGMYAGTGVTDDSNYLRISNQFIEAHNLPIRLYSSASRVMALEPSANPYLAIGYPIPTGYLSQNGIWMGKSSVDGTYKMHVGTVSGSTLLKGLSWDGSNLFIKGNVVVGDGAIGYGVNVGDAYLVNRFDGPYPYESDYTGDLIGHKGQVPSVSGGNIFRSGKFGKALQLSGSSQNEIANPSFEVDLAGWSAALGSGSLLVDRTKSYVGQSCLKVIAGSATSVFAYTALSRTISDGETVSFSGHIWENSGSLTSGTIILYDASASAIRSVLSPSTQNAWERVSGSWTNTTGGPVTVRVYLNNTNTDSSIVWFDGIQAEVGNTTPYLDGSLGVGHVWTGTPHNSISTRSNSVFNYNTVSGSNIINLNSGTFMCWYYNDSINTGIKYLATGVIGTGNYLSILASTSAVFTPYAISSSGSISVSTNVVPSTAVSGWNHIAVTWITGSLILYLNGVQSGATANYVVPEGTLNTFWLGQTQASTQFLNGLIDELVILPTVLSSQEIKSVYQSNAPVIVTTSVNSIYLRGTRETGYIRGNAYGLLGYSSTSGSNNTGSFALVTSDGVNLGTEFGSPSLNAGDVLFGSVATNQANLFYDRSEGTLSLRNNATSLVALNASGAITVGNTAGSGYILLDSASGILLYSNGQKTVELNNASVLTLGNTTFDNLVVSSSAIYIKQGGNIYANLTGSSLTLGNTANTHLIASSSAVYIKSGTDIYTNLTSGSLMLGLMSSGEYISIDPNNGLRLYGSGNLNGQWLNNGDITLGYVATNKANVFWDVSEGIMSFRGGTNGTIAGVIISASGAIVAGAGSSLYLDSNGISAQITTGKDNERSYKFSLGATLYSSLYAYYSANGNVQTQEVEAITGKESYIVSNAYSPTAITSHVRLNAISGEDMSTLDLYRSDGDSKGTLSLSTADLIISNGGLKVGVSAITPNDDCVYVVDYLVAAGGIYSGLNSDPGAGNIAYTGGLISRKGATSYDAYAFVPLTVPLISTSWDGDSFSTTAKTLIDLSSVFGAPAGIKAVKVYVAVKDSDSAATDTYLVLGPTSDSGSGIPFSPLTVNDRWYRGGDDIPCDSNGDIYYQIVASGASTFDVVLQIWGYYI